MSEVRAHAYNKRCEEIFPNGEGFPITLGKLKGYKRTAKYVRLVPRDTYYVDILEISTGKLLERVTSSEADYDIWKGTFGPGKDLKEAIKLHNQEMQDANLLTNI